MSGINQQSDDDATLQIGPTDHGMVRIFVSSGSAEIPMDFAPDEAMEIAEELRIAAETITKSGGKSRAKSK